MKSRTGGNHFRRVVFLVGLMGIAIGFSPPQSNLAAYSRVTETSFPTREFYIASLVQDINPYNNNQIATLSALTVVEDKLFFSSCGEYECEIWVSDGTLNGTLRVKAGLQHTPYSLTAANGLLFFFANDGVHGYELWKSDATPAGTQMVMDITPGPGSSVDPVNYAPAMGESGGYLYFTANDGVHGYELWRSDGSPAGTALVKDIYPGTGEQGLNSSYPWNLTNINGTLYFQADDGVHGRELWKSNGSETGTQMVVDLYPGLDSSSPDLLVEVAGVLYFVANDGIHTNALWKSDGSPAGTTLVKEFYPEGGMYSGIIALVNLDETLYIFYNNIYGFAALWKSDGSEAGTVLVKEVETQMYSQNYFVVAGNLLYFLWSDSINGPELWRSDGTPDGTTVVKDIYPGPLYDYPDEMPPSELTAVGDRLYFVAQDGIHGYELWVSDGTEAGTYMVKDINPSKASNPYELTGLNGVGYFFADNGIHGVQLWASDGSVANTNMVYANVYETVFRSPHNLTPASGTLFFAIDDGLHGDELWKSEGTAGGTLLVKDIFPGVTELGYNSSHPAEFVDFNGTLYFAAEDTLGSELWQSDGTEAGTVLVQDIYPGMGESEPAHLTTVGETFFFTANDGIHGTELWKSDGSQSGTILVKDIYPGTGEQGPNSSTPLEMTNINGTLYFTADDGVHGYELWKSDGSESGTFMVSDLNPGVDSAHPFNFTEFNGLVYCFANIDYTQALWKSDGTPSGTELLAILTDPGELTRVDNRLYFRAVAWNYGGIAALGAEFWASDGTGYGTWLVKDINTRGTIFDGTESSYPGEFIEMNGRLFFAATDQTSGREVWTSDGTAENTLLFVDIKPGLDETGLENSSNPSQFTVVNDRLIFSADDGVHDTELWLYDGVSGAILLKDIHPEHASDPGELTAVGDSLFFVANDGVYGSELWVYRRTALPYQTHLPIVH